MIIVDETMAGERLHTFTLESLNERMTVREIIRARIWQEVHEYNAGQRASVFRGLVQPSQDETRLNGIRQSVFKPIDWESQYELALRAFESNGFFMLVGDRQAEGLDDTFLIEADTEVGFVKFVPLVGG